MKRTVLKSILAGLLLLWVAPAYSASISGIVINEQTGELFADVNVHLINADDDSTITIRKTNEKGRYFFNELDPGNYYLLFTSIFTNELHDNSRCPTPDCAARNLIEPIVLQANETKRMDAELAPSGRVIFTYKDAETGELLKDVVGTLTSVGENPDYDLRRSSVEGVVDTTHLEPGSYFLTLRKARYLDSNVTVRPCPGENCGPENPRKLVTVLPGVALRETFTMNSGGSIKGKVTTPANSLLVEDTVSIAAVTAEGHFVSTGFADREDGTYEIPALPPGDYYLLAYTSGIFPTEDLIFELFPNIHCPWLRCDFANLGSTITIEGGETAEADFEMDLGGSIFGVISMAPESASTSSTGSATHTEAAGQLIDDGRVIAYSLDGNIARISNIADDGTYNLGGLPDGDYYVVADGRNKDKQFIDELFDGIPCLDSQCDFSSTGARVSVQLGSPVEINFELSEAADPYGRISVGARDPRENRGVGGATVQVIALDGTVIRERELTLPYSFEFDGIPPGDYVVFFKAPPGSVYSDTLFGDVSCPNLSCDFLALGEKINVTRETPVTAIVNMVREDVETQYPPERIESAITGSWYSPDSSGEGFMIHGTGENQAVLYFYGYDNAGKRLWLVGSASQPMAWGSSVEFDLIEATGGSFPNFDPNTVVRTAWGKATFAINDCFSGSIELAGKDGTKTIEVSRLADVSGAECSSAANLPATDSVTGSWYDPKFSGQGFAIQKLSTYQGIVYFYGFEPNGDPLWLVGTWDKRLDFGEQLDITLYQSIGGTFDKVDPAAITKVPWGTVSLNIADCSNGTATMRRTEGSFIRQDLEINELASTIGLNCTPPN